MPLSVIENFLNLEDLDLQNGNQNLNYVCNLPDILLLYSQSASQKSILIRFM